MLLVVERYPDRHHVPLSTSDEFDECVVLYTTPGDELDGLGLDADGQWLPEGR